MKLGTRLSALALVSALVLTGCGDDTKNDDAVAGAPGTSSSSPGTDATDAATDAETDGADTDTAAGEAVDIDDFLADLREGADDMTSAHMSATMELAGQAMEMEGDVDYNDGEPRMLMTMTVPGMGGMEMRMIGKVIYMKIPGQTGGKFVKMDLSDPNGPLGEMSSLFDQMDPAKAFETYSAGFTAATFLGQDEHGGEMLDHYRVKVDTSKVDQFKQLPSQAGVPKTLEYDLWLDDDHRMRGMKMDVPGAGTMDMTVSDLGKDVTVEEPSESEITTMPGM